MMQVRWVVKTTPRVKSKILAACVELWGKDDGTSKVAGDMIAEVFDIKRSEGRA